MKIAVFGATGQTGRQVVRQALDAGHEVTAVVRDPGRLNLSHDRLTIAPADLFDPESIGPVVKGSDAVVSALGASSREETTSVCAKGVRSMIEAGARRLVVVSNSAHTAARGDSVLRRVFIRLLGRILKNPFDDLKRMEQQIRSSDVEWTIVRPARLTNGAHTGRYRTATGGHVPSGWRISRADVADLMLRSLRDETTIGELVGVAY